MTQHYVRYSPDVERAEPAPLPFKVAGVEPSVVLPMMLTVTAP